MINILQQNFAIVYLHFWKKTQYNLNSFAR